MSTLLKIYIRSGCHLCDDMLVGLKGYQQECDFTLEIIDIMGKPLLETEFGQRIPILMRDNEVLCEFFLDPTVLKGF